MNAHHDMTAITEGLPTKAAKIRALDDRGYPRAEIARFLDIRYQHVRNTLERPRPVHDQPRVGAARGPLVSGAGLTLVVAGDGAVRIPEHVLAHMHLGEDRRVTARIDEDGELTLVSRESAVVKAQRIARSLDRAGGSVVDELIADRRAEAEGGAG